ncbi:MAG: hypothetical protein Q7S45_04245 [Candidatus Curtissbacteria bacterium]|nr:hypothetical protein [Candidatus Curtissbacteria bacterium]
MRKTKHLLIIILLSLSAFLIHGYQFAVSDQEIFITYILKSQDPSLFQSDALFNQSSAHLSLFYPVIGFLTKFVDIQVTFVIGYLIFQFAFFVALYRLSRILLKDNDLAYFSLLPFLLPKFIGGTAAQTFDLFFGYRSIGVIFLVFYLSFLLEKKYIKSIFFASVGFLFHPLSIIPNILLLPVLAIQSSKSRVFDSLKYIILPMVIGLTLFAIFGQSFTNSSPLKDNLWLSIIRFRDDYLFISSWTLRAWGAFALYFFLIVIFLKKVQKSLIKPIIIISFVSLILFLINSFVLETLKIPLVAEFQLVRSINPIAYIGLALSPLFLVPKNYFQRILGGAAFIFLCLNLFDLFFATAIIFTFCLLLNRNEEKVKPRVFNPYAIPVITFILYIALNIPSYLNFQEKIQFPKKQDDWINVQKWASQNTAKSAKFLVPPDQTGFRIFSSRPIVGDIKDGAVVIYSPQYAIYWSNLMADTANYQNLESGDFLALKRKYSFSYFVTTALKNLPLEVVFKNNSFIVYKF